MQFLSANAGFGRGERWRRFLRSLDLFAHREWRWIVVIAWLIIAGAYLNTYSASIHWFALGDTDDNMRYLQVRDWINGQSWWDLTQHRMNPPQGANIHWSRLVDLPIAALMLFFRLFMDPLGADRMACAVAPLIPLLPLMLALAFIARRLAPNGHAWFAAMLLPLGADMGLSMYMPLRVDHHNWQLALTAITLAGLVDRKWVRGGIVAGVSSAASVAIGMEMMVYLAGAGALIALRWIFKEGAARRLQPYALSLGGTTAIGYAAFASNANRLPMCDALSPVWTSILVLSAGVLLAMSVLPLRHWWQRFLIAGVGAVIIAAFAWLSYPQCLTGAYQLTPELQKSWLVYIREAKPIYVQSRGVWVPMMALPATGMLCALIGLIAMRRDFERLWAWGTVALMIAFAIALTFWQIRAGPAAQLLALPPIGWAIWALLMHLVRGRALARIGSALGLILLGCIACAYDVYPPANGAIANWTGTAKPPVATTPAPNATTPKNRTTAKDEDDDDDDDDSPYELSAAKRRKAKARPLAATKKLAAASAVVAGQAPPKKKTASANARCRTQPALLPLDQLAPATIFTMVDLGPRIIAVTHHSVIAGPYHRNGKAILDIHHAFDGSPARFQAIAAQHGATYLLICPGFPEGTIYQQRSPNGFYARLMHKESFPFLTPVKLNYPGDLPYQLYRIERGVGSSTKKSG